MNKSYEFTGRGGFKTSPKKNYRSQTQFGGLSRANEASASQAALDPYAVAMR